MPSGHSHSETAASYLFVISHLLTTAIVGGEVTSSGVALASLFEGVIMNFKQKLMACTALLGVWLFHPATAGAQSAEAQKIERLERQTELLQRQLKEIQEELARTRKRTEKVEAKVEAAPARYSAPPPASALVTKGPPPPPERVKVTLGGFVAAETVWRQHNMVNDMGTAFATTPYPFSPLYNEHEFHGSPGRAESRCSSRATSIPTKSFPGITSRTSWASATRRITTRATAGLRACAMPISPTTTLVGEAGDFTSRAPL